MRSATTTNNRADTKDCLFTPCSSILGTATDMDSSWLWKSPQKILATEIDLLQMELLTSLHELSPRDTGTVIFNQSRNKMLTEIYSNL